MPPPSFLMRCCCCHCCRSCHSTHPRHVDVAFANVVLVFPVSSPVFLTVCHSFPCHRCILVFFPSRMDVPCFRHWRNLSSFSASLGPTGTFITTANLNTPSSRGLVTSHHTRKLTDIQHAGQTKESEARYTQARTKKRHQESRETPTLLF